MSKPTKLEKKATNNLEQVLRKLDLLPKDFRFVAFRAHSDLDESKTYRVKNEKWKLVKMRFLIETNRGEYTVFLVSDTQVGTYGGIKTRNIQLQKTPMWKLECVKQNNIVIWKEQSP